MSADNGVYVAKFPDGFRVCFASAIENLDYFPEGSEDRKTMLKSYFGDSKLFSSKEEALLFAHKEEETILNDGWFIEYGVSYIGEYESFL